MSDTPDRLWTPVELGEFLRLSPKTIRTQCSRSPDKLPPRVKTLSAPCWEPGVVRAWVIKHSGDGKRKGGRPRG